jgi:hypothetical protein
LRTSLVQPASANTVLLQAACHTAVKIQDHDGTRCGDVVVCLRTHKHSVDLMSACSNWSVQPQTLDIVQTRLETKECLHTMPLTCSPCQPAPGGLLHVATSNRKQQQHTRCACLQPMSTSTCRWSAKPALQTLPNHLTKGRTPCRSPAAHVSQHQVVCSCVVPQLQLVTLTGVPAVQVAVALGQKPAAIRTDHVRPRVSSWTLLPNTSGPHTHAHLRCLCQ